MKSFLVFTLIVTSLSAFANRESGGRASASAVFLNFTSPGNGIDVQSLNLADNLITQASQDGLVKEIVRKRWGREGEVTLCVHFQGGAHNGAAPSRDFIRGVANSIFMDTLDQGLQRTKVLLGVSCKNIEEATEQSVEAYLD